MPKHIESLGAVVEHDIKKALKWGDIANILRIQLERQETKYFPTLREYSNMYGVTTELLEEIGRDDIIIMHPGPMNRGIEISSEVADSKNAIILDQVENGVAIRMAILYLLAGKRG
jgi:aspartate carbamoyltransferase catalytic subunit